MEVVFSLNFGRFVLVFIAFRVFLAVPMVSIARFSPSVYLVFALLNHCACGFKGGWGKGA